MLFISNGAQLLEKKIEMARRRMFLFSDDVEPPTDKSAYPDVISKFNLSRSFCALVDDQNQMQCVRGAGWKGNNLYYNYVPGVRKAGYSDTGGNRVVSAFDMFCRYYAIGKDDDTSTTQWGTGSLLDTYNNPAPLVPAYNDMVMPAIDGSGYSMSVYSVPTTSVGMSQSTSGTITGGGGSGIGYWSNNITSSLQNVGITSFNVAADTATVTVNTMPLNNTSANTPYNHGNFANTTFPRLFQPYQTRVYGTNYFSGGGWSYSTTYSAGAYSNSPSTVDKCYFGQGTHADTPAYAIKWGAMAIAFAKGAPVYVVVTKASVDFDVVSDIVPNEIPSATLKGYSSLFIESRYRL
ncbi:hypothetical protein MPK71_gp093 [Erwinia phage pEa_SNUABM_1]|uniref:Uncharacterized protein n=1 Tax=Erwinia phage pEa_SNUABM_1 TaxID=2869543 RepID=A0AAE7XL35_9CAUD|nr:hypothetical protein MPK71_gp093 [Erwinia phage pEa_SNUABM_1]QZE57302.1 hypothetical protein pEaSNUABM1_00093 [Erwinia phage pEa_SNUABM_1]